MPARTRFRNAVPQVGTMTEEIDSTVVNTADTIDYQRSEVMNDFVTPGYRKLIKAGAIINNAVSYTSDTIRDTTGGSYYAKNISTGRIDRVYGDGCFSQYMAEHYPILLPPALNIDFDKSKIMSEAKLRALGKIDSTPYSFGEDVGELRETLEFLRHPIYDLDKVSEKFFNSATRRLKRQRYKDRALCFSETWAQYRFVISPLVRSIHDLVEAYSAKVVRPERRIGRGFVKFSDSKFRANVPKYSYRWNQHTKTDYLAKAGVLYEIANPVIDWRFKYGLRFKDIPTTLWQVSPYSFMVDRVVNISSGISGIINFLDPKVKILAAWTTEHYEETRELSAVNQVAPGYDVTINPDTAIYTEFKYNRDPWTPSVLDTLPPINIKGLVDSVTKTADLLALITLRFK